VYYTPNYSTTEEYLLSAGNVLSRGQLRSCLRDARILHREFWDLPSNHPEKAEVAGSGIKNRYRSILPNERSRVRLPVGNEDLLTGYINANYVRVSTSNVELSVLYFVLHTSCTPALE
jgi:receptor-type tyrosine-protein phosphatase R